MPREKPMTKKTKAIEPRDDMRLDSFCILPWISQYVATTGKIAPCCEYDADFGNIADVTLEEVWKGKETQELRRKFLAGEKAQACWKCFDRDKNEGDSQRQINNALFSDWVDRIAGHQLQPDSGPQYPATLDLRFSNLCNFKCRSCWHGSSSKWFVDGKAIRVTAGDTAEIRSFDKTEDIAAHLLPYIAGLEDIYFAGGEPLMMAEHYTLLNLLIEHKRTDVRLRYTTNMSLTHFRGQSIYDLWQKFDNIRVEASVDASGARGAIIRNGFDWETFVENIVGLRSQCPHVELHFGMTISAFNILELPQLMEDLRDKCAARPAEFHTHSLQEPGFLRSQILPPKLKKRASATIDDYIDRLTKAGDMNAQDLEIMREKLDGIKAYMNTQDLQQQIGKFKARVEKLDSLRAENSQETFPELREIWTHKSHFWSKGSKFMRLFGQRKPA